MVKKNIISFDNVFFGYDKKKILDGVSFNLPQGTITSVFGSSGAGKTTILKLISGQSFPNSGTVIFDEFEVSSLGSNKNKLYNARSRMGLLFQFGALFTDLNVFDNIAFPIRENSNLDEESIHDLVKIKLNAVGLNGIEKMMPEHLSGGMARRVALARSIALDPFLLMYDEPFTGLDPLSVQIISKLIKQLNDSLGLTSILVSHDIKTSLEISDRIIILSNGKIVCNTTPEEIASTYGEKFLEFFGGFTNNNKSTFMKSIGL